MYTIDNAFLKTFNSFTDCIKYINKNSEACSDIKCVCDGNKKLHMDIYGNIINKEKRNLKWLRRRKCLPLMICGNFAWIQILQDLVPKNPVIS